MINQSGDESYRAGHKEPSASGVIASIIAAIVMSIVKNLTFITLFAVYAFRPDLPECTACPQFDIPI